MNLQIENIFQQSYLMPLRESRILNEAEIDVIFSHVESIKNFNHEFLEALENRMKNWTSKTLLADIFLTYVSIIIIRDLFARERLFY